MDIYLDFCNWKNVVTVQTLKWNTCIAFHYKFSCSDYHQLQSTDYTPNTPSQAMHVWTQTNKNKASKPLGSLTFFAFMPKIQLLINVWHKSKIVLSPLFSPICQSVEGVLDYKIMMHYLNLMLLKLCVGAVVVMIVWQLNLQLPMQSVPITTDVVSSNLDQDEVYNIKW
jgi:hypothetical protein